MDRTGWMLRVGSLSPADAIGVRGDVPPAVPRNRSGGGIEAVSERSHAGTQLVASVKRRSEWGRAFSPRSC